MGWYDLDPKTLSSPEHQIIDDEISRAAFDLLLKEPFYDHVPGKRREGLKHGIANEGRAEDLSVAILKI